MSSKRDAEQRLIDQNKPLMDLCTKVAHDLYLAEEAKAMWLWVADHAKSINDAKFGKFFGIFQRMALTEMFVAIGRVYDEERYGDKVCLKAVLDGMRTANLIDRDVFVAFLGLGAARAKRWAPLSDTEVREQGVELIFQRKPSFKSSVALGRVLEVRHTEVAHRSAAPVYGRGRPRFEDVDHCLTWGKEFLGMVGKAFGNHVFKHDDGGFWSDYPVNSSIMSLRRLTHRARIVLDPHLTENERFAAAATTK
jgi:hypothetical protein